MSAPEYELFYWPSIQGRGEFVRLALEDAGANYVDVARSSPKQGGGVPALMALMREPGAALEPFAPPFLRHKKLVIAQTALILHYLAPLLRLVPASESMRLRAHQLQLTVSDLVLEAHDTHHPVASSLYFEDQKPEAQRRSAEFTKQRMAKFLGYFERVLTANGGKFLVGKSHSYVDLSLFQAIEGLRYAFPRAMKRLEPTIPNLVALHDRVAKRPRTAAYLASDRRIAFNEMGIFRHYPELDARTR